MQVHRGFIPFLTPRTPALVDTMFRDLDGRGHGHIYDLSAARQTQTSQTQLTRGARDQPMLHDLRWRGGARSRSIMPRVTLLTSLLLFLWRVLLIRLDESWRRRFQLLEFLNACLGDSHLFGDFIKPL